MFVLVFLAMCVSLPTAGQSTPRLLILGDSLTTGCCATSLTRTFRYLVAGALDADLGGDGLYNLPTVALNFDKYATWRPDIIVLEVGINDALHYGPNQIAESDYQAAYGALLDRMLAITPRVIVVTPFAAVGHGDARRAGLLRYRDYILAAATERGLTVADLWAVSDGCVDCKSKTSDSIPFSPVFKGDNFHPGDLGHRLIADTILAAITHVDSGGGTVPPGTIPPPIRTYLPSVCVGAC
jgi:lysophospholipase L1-like esterase